MKNLLRLETPPTYFELHVNIVASKQNPRRANLEAIADSIRDRFTEYDTAVARNSLNLFLEDTELQACGDDLQHCYEVKTRALADLLNSIKVTQRSEALHWCPYCGLTAPGSFDHYLPKQRFPEFSVNPQNLIPSCTKCNSVKGARWRVADSRLFIHFYSDQLPEEQFLFVELDHQDRAFSASFRIERPDQVDPTCWRTIDCHFRELNLLEEYRDKANHEFAKTIGLCNAHLQNGGADISGFLEVLVNEEEKRYGRNHWRNVLLKALAADPHFTNEVSIYARLAS